MHIQIMEVTGVSGFKISTAAPIVQNKSFKSVLAHSSTFLQPKISVMFCKTYNPTTSHPLNKQFCQLRGSENVRRVLALFFFSI